MLKMGKKKSLQCQFKETLFFWEEIFHGTKTFNHPKRTPQPRHQEVAAKDPSSHILARDPFKKDPQHGGTAVTAFPKKDTKKYKSWSPPKTHRGPIIFPPPPTQDASHK